MSDLTWVQSSKLFANYGSTADVTSLQRVIKVLKNPLCKSSQALQTGLRSLDMANSRVCKVSKVAKIRNRHNQAPHLTQDTNGKVTNSQKTPQTRAKRSAPPPSRRPRSTHKQTRTQHSKHKTEQKQSAMSTSKIIFHYLLYIFKFKKNGLFNDQSAPCVLIWSPLFTQDIGTNQNFRIWIKNVSIIVIYCILVQSYQRISPIFS